MASKFIAIVNGIPRMTSDPSTATIYDQIVTVGVGGLTTGTAMTLPSSQTYNSSELEVYLNGQIIDSVLDYNYVSSPPRTQVTFTFNLVQGDQVRFRISRGY